MLRRNAVLFLLQNLVSRLRRISPERCWVQTGPRRPLGVRPYLPKLFLPPVRWVGLARLAIVFGTIISKVGLAMASRQGREVVPPCRCLASEGLGTCWLMPCFGWRGNVTCYQGQCLCEANTCAGPEGLCHRVDDWERNVVARGVKFLTANDSQYRAISENSNFTALTADEENASNFTVFSLPGVGQYGKVMVAAFDSPSWILSTKIKWDSCSDHRSLQHYDADQKKAGVQSHKNQSFSPWTNGASLFGGDTSESEWGGYTHVGQVSWLDWWRINWFAGKHLDGIGYDGMSVKHERLALRSVDDSALPFDDRVALKLAWVDQPSGTIGVQFQSVLQTPEYLPCMDNLTSWSHTCLSAGTGRLAVSQPLELCGLLPHSRWQTQPRVRDSCCAKCELSILYLS